MISNALKNELLRYRIIIDLVGQMVVLRRSGVPIAEELKKLQIMLNECELTTIKISGTEHTPLGAATAMFNQNMEDNLFAGKIEEANYFYNKLLSSLHGV